MKLGRSNSVSTRPVASVIVERIMYLIAVSSGLGFFRAVTLKKDEVLQLGSDSNHYWEKGVGIALTLLFVISAVLLIKAARSRQALLSPLSILGSLLLVVSVIATFASVKNQGSGDITDGQAYAIGYIAIEQQPDQVSIDKCDDLADVIAKGDESTGDKQLSATQTSFVAEGCRDATQKQSPKYASDVEYVRKQLSLSN